ncbi:hypothetical protein ACHAXR_004668 [Thalassiosira sp. AJA248-18]
MIRIWRINVLFLLALCCTITATALFASAFSHTPIRTFTSIRRGDDCRTILAGRHHDPLLLTLPRGLATRFSQVTLFSSKPPTSDFFKGAPSTPGFKPGQFDKLSSWAQSTSSNRPIVTEYDPDGFWLWTQWDGTIREMIYKNIIISLIWALVVDLYAYQHYTVYLIATAAVNGGDVGSLMDTLTWASFEIPHSKDPFIETLTALNSLWEYQLNLTIFTLSFFVNHAYSSWRGVYFCTRAIQGRINDLCLLVTMAAKRTAHYGDVEGTTGYQTTIGIDDDNIVTESDNHRDAKRLVQDVTRMLRMSHVFFWAATPTCSDGFGDTHHTEGGIVGDDDSLPQDFDPSQFGPMLLSTQGLQRLVRLGEITENEMKALVSTGLPPSQYPYVLLEWAGLRCMDGMEQGELRGGPGMEENLLRYITQLRAEYFSIGDFAAGRMPMAYTDPGLNCWQVQIMEVLVDTLVFLAPLALYVKMGTFNIISTALLTLFFKGLLELSKSFLDPFGREGYRAHNIRVDVLVSEMNFGASSRWVNAGDSLPSELLNQSTPADQPAVVASQGTSFADINESTTDDQPSLIDSQGTSFAAWMEQDYDSPSKDSTSANKMQPEAQVTSPFVKSKVDVENINGLSSEGRGLNGL